MTSAEISSGFFNSDYGILSRDYTAQMVPKSFQLAYTVNQATSKLRLTAFRLIDAATVEGVEQLLPLEQHGNQSATLVSSSETLPVDIS